MAEMTDKQKQYVRDNIGRYSPGTIIKDQLMYGVCRHDIYKLMMAEGLKEGIPSRQADPVKRKAFVPKDKRPVKRGMVNVNDKKWFI